MTAANARSQNGGKATFQETLVTRKINFAVISKVNCRRRAPSKRKYRGSVLYVHKDYKRPALRIKDKGDNTLNAYM